VRVNPYFQNDTVTLYCADCNDVLPTLSGIHSCVTDPPYGLRFMGKAWDYDVPEVATWEAVLESLLPGAHLLSFAGTRTQHRMAVNIEDAGFEVRDMIAWVYGQGFPKSLDVAKGIDKAAGATPIDTGIPSSRHNSHSRGSENSVGFQGGVPNITAPATDAARQWAGWGTALKPSLEPITLARKPFACTVAANVLEYGTGAINVDGCRVATNGETPRGSGGPCKDFSMSAIQPGRFGAKPSGNATPPQGRWPANLIHDGSEEVVGLFPVTTSGAMNGVYRNTLMAGKPGQRDGKAIHLKQEASTGSAARFFYCAKASKSDRDEGCEGLEEKEWAFNSMGTQTPESIRARGRNPENQCAPRRNHHPTVKPTALMRYLCRFVTPPGGIVLDPFMGSGSTGKAAVLEGFRFIGIERDEESCKIAVARITAAKIIATERACKDCQPLLF
jgi:DNA modification methylase